MNNRSLHYIISMLFLFALAASSQNETKKWYFGNQAGLDFSTNPPTILTNGQLNSPESSASISDNAGNLLFYTDGNTIWDKTHTIMANGTGLLGHQSTSQGPLILKKPGSNILYYLITLDSGSWPNGLMYSVVDISLASGNGSVTLKNVPLTTPSEEKLTAVRHANGMDFWVITHDYVSGSFRSFSLNGNGIGTTSVISNVGSFHNGSLLNSLGYLKSSPDGKKLGCAIAGLNICELYDFDNLSGILSNPIVLTNSLAAAYGCEFSPDGSKFYAAGLNDTVIYQWDLCKTNTVDIVLSKTIINTTPISICGMQVAPNGKIYAAHLNQQILGVINDPNIVGVNCNYVDFGQSVSPKLCLGGLPNFPNYYFYSGPTLTISSSNNFTMCAGDSHTLSVSGANSYLWSTANAGASVVVTPTLSTTYSVVGTTSNGCKFDAALTVNVNACTNVYDLSEIDLMKIYPNPVTSDLFIESNGFSEPMKASVYNTFNVLLFSIEINSNHQKVSLSVLRSGLYFLCIEGKNYNKKFKILKE